MSVCNCKAHDILASSAVRSSINICGYYYLAKHKELSANVVWAEVWLSTWNGVAAAAVLYYYARIIMALKHVICPRSQREVSSVNASVPFHRVCDRERE